MSKYALLLAQFRSSKWAITPEWYANLERILEERAAGQPLTPEARAEMEAQTYGAATDRQPDKVAVLQVYGPIVPRADLISEYSALASHQGIAQALRAAADDDSVREIIMDVDSPGGAVAGIDVSLEAMRYAAAKKSVTVVCEGILASAAYWIGAQANRVVVTPTAIVGSISVIMDHRDITEAQRQMGIKTTILATGKWKSLGHSTEPLTDEGKDKLLGEMMQVHDLFVADIAAGRRVSAEAAQERWADGSVWIGGQALDAGLVDEIGTMQSVLDALSKPSGPGRGRGAKANMDMEQLKAEHPELYAQIMAQGKADGMAEAQTQAAASQSGIDLEKEVVRLRASTERLEREGVEEKRKNIASTALETAALPKAGITPSGLDLDLSFRGQVEGLALGAASDDEARTRVDAAITERRALMGEKKSGDKERRAFLPTGDVNAEKQPQAKANEISRARRSIGL